ncbi:MAG: transglutaminase domain-containing protein [Bacteroidetes bacterium]|nr:transglutaminase domain-containing protein [Bacteroidota bacterium]
MSFFIVVATSNVSGKLTKSDKESIESFIADLKIDKDLIHRDYDYQINVLTQINSKVLSHIKNSSDGIPLGESREPSFQIEKGYGQCFDRSRLIEKTCKYLGLKTRHIYIINNESKTSLIKNLLSQNTTSHASSEVKTLRGWLIVDSNFEWLSIDKNGNPISFSNIKGASLQNSPPSEVFPFYKNNIYYIYGFYSRHGQFYKPYNPIPDYNLRELLYNF